MCMGHINEANYLPQELITNILSRLPVKSLLRFKSICKSWRDLIITRQFIHLHLKRSQEANSGGVVTLFHNTSSYTLNFYRPSDPLAVELHSPSFLDYYKSRWNELGPPVLVGSCNGLLCFALPWDVYVLYNPSTRLFKLLPKVTRTRVYGFRVYSLFVYDHVNDDYKVFELFQFNRDHRFDNVVGVESLIFSTKANSWKTIDTDVPYRKHKFVVANKSLRWVDREAMTVRSFNLLTERYDEDVCEIPAVMSSIKDVVANQRGDLEILVDVLTGEIVEIALWSTHHWNALPVVYFKNNSTVKRKWEESERVFGWSDPKDGQVTGVRISVLSEKEVTVTSKTWAESLVSLE